MFSLVQTIFRVASGHALRDINLSRRILHSPLISSYSRITNSVVTSTNSSYVSNFSSHNWIKNHLAKQYAAMKAKLDLAERYYAASMSRKMEEMLQEADKLAEEFVENNQPIPKEYYLKKAILLAKTTVDKGTVCLGRDEEAISMFSQVPAEDSNLYRAAILALARMFTSQIPYFSSHIKKQDLEEKAKRYYRKFKEKYKDEIVEAEYQTLIEKNKNIENITFNRKSIDVNYNPTGKEKFCKRPSIKELQRMGILTPYECATMTGYLYGDITKYTLPPHWKIICQLTDLPPDIKNRCDILGYIGVAFENEMNGKIVLAHKGTYDKNGLAADTELVFGEIPGQFNCAEEFTHYVAQRHNVSSQVIIQTGHSLGAAIAELCAAAFGSRAITFESPGVKNLMLCDREKFKLQHSAKNITTYLSYPNLVNTYDKHVGRIIHIPTPKEAKNFIGHVLDYKGFLSGASSITFQNIKAHGIEGLWEAFDKETGYPKEFFCMQSWPSSTKRFVYLIKFASEKRVSINPDAYFFNPNLNDFKLNKIIKYKMQEGGKEKSPTINLSDFDDYTRDFLLNYAKSKEYRENVNQSWNHFPQKGRVGDIECFLSYTLEPDGRISVRAPFMADEFQDYVVIIRSPFMADEFIEGVGKVVAIHKELSAKKEMQAREDNDQRLMLRW